MAQRPLELTYHDFPFAEVVEEADKLIKAGATVWQKFTCQQCQARQTMETPNVFHELGTCEVCGALTNIRERGCNYLMAFAIKGGKLGNV